VKNNVLFIAAAIKERKTVPYLRLLKVSFSFADLMKL